MSFVILNLVSEKVISYFIAVSYRGLIVGWLKSTLGFKMKTKPLCTLISLNITCLVDACSTGSEDRGG